MVGGVNAGDAEGVFGRAFVQEISQGAPYVAKSYESEVQEYMVIQFTVFSFQLSFVSFSAVGARIVCIHTHL